MTMIVLFWLVVGSIIPGPGKAAASLRIDFYAETSCPQAEQIIFTQVQKILQNPEFNNAPAELLRLFFHDCFIKGCDASVGRPVPEKDSIPNKKLKGFEIIDMIKEALEKECPGIVSCSDILALAARDAISLSGGPFYPLYTGRRDSKLSFNESLNEIPRPFGKIDDNLKLFTDRGFTVRETVALLGGHSIGFISCQFIQPPNDTYLPDDFKEEIRQKCQNMNNNFSMMDPVLIFSVEISFRNSLLRIADQKKGPPLFRHGVNGQRRNSCRRRRIRVRRRFHFSKRPHHSLD
ncbi:OLC1v1037695C1 [Oldenlandia corymbosa var. corymbosa]|uniref:Peroxidase n=1 Tax=Oldenlandia corymbosa var. corymbosa TaxID=529605 RepID=A0AAV1CZ70_OLDCO|nr:OLC1v1037695C1 [Oldenlandia corymbosa var. corymbosa]